MDPAVRAKAQERYVRAGEYFGFVTTLLLASASRPLFRTWVAARFDPAAVLAHDDWLRHRY